MNHEISIIIPIYNRVKTLIQCLGSLEKQTFQNFEVIIVDDESTEDVKSVLPTILGSAPVKYLKITHGGANKARNAGFRASKGFYLLFLDADIVCKPQMLEKMLNTLKNANFASYCYASFKNGWKSFKLQAFDPEKLKKVNYIHTSSLIRRQDFPGFDESLKRFQDWDLWLSMLEQNKVGVWIPEILFQIKSQGTMSSWLPKFFYNFFWLKKVKKYHEAENFIIEKHDLQKK